MAIDFPASPTTGQTYTFNGVTYKFSAAGVWEVVGGNVATSTVNVQVFNASGTYTPIPGMRYCQIECIGGGGGGGGSAAGVGSATQAAGGGGSGAYSRKTVSAAVIGANKSVTIGAGGTAGAANGGTGGTGGTTTVAGLCTAAGGLGGVTASVSAQGGAGGDPSIGIGDIVAGGNPGECGAYLVGSVSTSAGSGGSAFFGGGGLGGTWSGTSAVGSPGRAYGGGGGGGLNFDVNTQRAGGVGAPGVVIITEYL